MRLAIACSFEIERYLENSAFFKEYQYFVNSQINSFSSWICKYLNVHNSPSYVEFIQSVRFVMMH